MEKIKNNKIDTNLAVIHEEDLKSITQYFTFRVGNETYGTEVKHVREVIEYEKVFPIPRVPAYISGVINLRGEIVPVIDMPQRFYKRNTDITINSAIVIIDYQYNSQTILLGMLIDEIEAVVNIKNNDISHMPEFGSKIKHEFINKIGKINEQFIIILNLDNVLNIEEISQLKE